MRLAVKSLVLLWILCLCIDAFGQQKLWHGIHRQLRYHPDGTDFVIQNGKRRFNRAIYGTNTAFRVEAGDLPEFALYLPGMGGNFKLGVIDGSQSKWLIDASSIEARYRPGSMHYLIKDPMLGAGTLRLEVLAGASTESMLVKANFTNMPNDLKLVWVYGGATGKKFSRDGDIGADPESSFYLQPDYCLNNTYQSDKNTFILNFKGKSLSEADRYEIDHTGKKAKTETASKNELTGIFPVGSQILIADAAAQKSPSQLIASKAGDRPIITGTLNPHTTTELYWLIQNGKLNPDTVNVKQCFVKAEHKREQLADRVVVHTPDPYINTLGGALSVAADAIWESPSYMHGAVAWRMRLPAWRGPYVADPLGWHDRAWTHFSSYAESQLTSPETGPVVADTALHLARQLEKIGTSMFSSGYICRNPGGDFKPNHYDMNLVYIDELLNHFKWTGNLDEVKKLWPTIKRHLAWEKRNFDADGDGLYDAYCCIWASDALQYSGGGVTHSSAYNYKANKMAAELAKLVGEDPTPYEQEAGKILKAVQSKLWLQRTGTYAEFKDLLGMQMLHTEPGIWTIYHAIDSDVPDAFQAYESLRYIDTRIPHIPVIANGLDGNYNLLSTTNWLPYTWSLNNVVMAENLHASLAYWQGGRSDTAFNLWKSAILESMFLGASPGNFQQISFYDAERGELYRDFADPIGMAARSLVEGLFGVRPDALHQTLTIQPGLPAAWNYASLKVPDINFDFKHNGNQDIYTIVPSFARQMKLNLLLDARAADIQSVTINGKVAKWNVQSEAVGKPVIELESVAYPKYVIKVTWKGAPVEKTVPLQKVVIGHSFTYKPATATVLKYLDPQKTFGSVQLTNVFKGVPVDTGYHTLFLKLKQGQMTWWQPVNVQVVKPVEVVADVNQPSNQLQFKIRNNGQEGNIDITVNPELPEHFKKTPSLEKGKLSANIVVEAKYLVPGSNHIHIAYAGSSIDTNIINWNIEAKNVNVHPVDISSYYNDEVNNIFKNKYLSPRPQVPTLQLPYQGIGNWCYPLATVNIDDSGLRKAADRNFYTLPQHITFSTPAIEGKNIVFTSQWDNYPKAVTIPLTGSAWHIYLLMAGSTNPMQSRLVNGGVMVEYTDGSKAMLQLKNPENWWPIEQDDDNDGFAFNTNAPRPLRVYLKEGKAALSYDHYTSIKGFTNRAIDGGAATVLDLPLDPHKQLKDLQLKTLANDVVIGLMAVSLLSN